MSETRNKLRSIWWGLHPDNRQRWKAMCGLCHEQKNRSAMVMGHSGPDGKSAGYKSSLQSIRVMTYNDAVICTQCWYDLFDKITEEE